MDIMVMQNTADLINSKNPKMTFDLKGSTVGRKSTLATTEKFWLTTQNQKKVMKDLNLLDINKDMDEKLIRLLPHDKQQLDHMIKRDSEFLMRHGLMDYSLLLVIEKIQAPGQDGIIDSDFSDKIVRNVWSEAYSRTSMKKYKTFYHIGIIDYLQLWDKSKRVEQCLKVKFRGHKSQELSAIEPKAYKQRFDHFISSRVFKLNIN